MADNVGFLDQIGLGSVDEETALDAQRSQAFRGRAAEQRALGRAAAPLVEGAGAALAGLFKPEGRTLDGVKSNFQTGFDHERDQQVAAAAGISVNSLRARRAVRRELGKEEFTDDGTLETRMRMAARTAKLASEHGDFNMQAQALSALDILRRQKAEFDKLKANNTRTEQTIQEEGLVDAFLDGKEVTGTLAFEDGQNGLIIADDQNNPKFVPFGSRLFREDPQRAASSTETLDQRLRRQIPKEEFKLIKDLIVNNDSALRKYDRVMSTLVDLHDAGGVESVIGASGNVTSAIDNFARNVSGTFRAFLGPGATKDKKLRSSWASRAMDPDDPMWDVVQLPEAFRNTSAAAQQHRANIMELAYMAARLAEPSNRGLSDNDIENALTRIAGSTSNPQVMMRRFVEMMADGAAELDTRIKTYHGSLEGVTNDRIDRALGGEALPAYRDRLASLYEKYDIEVGPAGRAKFGRVIDSDVSPGEGIRQTNPDDERQQRLNSILGN